MVTAIPNVEKSGHYNVTQTAKALGIDRKTLYKHTAMRHMKCQRHRYTNKPFYTGREIIRFWGAQY